MRDVVALRPLNTQIARRRRAAIGLAAVADGRCIAPGHRAAFVGRSVVDDYHLGGWQRLGQNALYGIAEIAFAIEDGNDHADPRLACR